MNMVVIFLDMSPLINSFKGWRSRETETQRESKGRGNTKERDKRGGKEVLKIPNHLISYV